MKKELLTYCPHEFGWELMAYQGHLRWLSSHFDIRVITRENREFLYKDFAKEIINYEFDGQPDGFHCRGMDEIKFNKFLELHKKDSKILKPFNIGFIPSKPIMRVTEDFKTKQTFIPLLSDKQVQQYDILIHARNRTLATERNWDYYKWEQLVELLIKDGYRVASIGTKKDAIHPINATYCYADYPLDYTVALMNKAKLVVGPSSGPMHLASLCGTPHLVWSIEYNRIRYTDLWNPFGTPVRFLSKGGWNPEVNNIYNLIKKLV